jgi:hypothetical protein
MGRAIHPLADPVIAQGDLANRTHIALCAFATLAILQSVYRGVHAIGHVRVDIAFIDFMAKPLLEHMRSLTGADKTHHPISAVVMPAHRIGAGAGAPLPT